MNTAQLYKYNTVSSIAHIHVCYTCAQRNIICCMCISEVTLQIIGCDEGLTEP